jgi:hypothetical protein
MEMGSGKKKGLAAMIVAGLPKPSGSVASKENEETMSDEAMAASDVMDALEAKDAAMLASALKGFMTMCGSSGSDQEEEESEGEMTSEE